MAKQITDPESHNKVALGQQLHPDVETHVACVFDVPEEAPSTLKLGLVFNDKKGIVSLYNWSSSDERNHKVSKTLLCGL